jgi:hypothetical protein
MENTIHAALRPTARSATRPRVFTDGGNFRYLILFVMVHLGRAAARLCLRMAWRALHRFRRIIMHRQEYAGHVSSIALTDLWSLVKRR